MAKAETNGRRRWWPGAILVLIALAATSAASSFTGPAYAADPLDKVDREVLSQVNAGGQATFWVIMKEQADLKNASGIGVRNARKQYVYDELTETAEKTQAPLRAELSKLNVSYKPYWIVNTIRVTAGEAVLRRIAEHSSVERIIPDGSFPLPKPEPGSSDGPKIATVEWGIANIRADQVWATFNARGEGIVVANIDTGVSFNHPALVAQYRGNLGGGSFDHNYNWHDPSLVCGNPSLVPCDNNGHGTHTMGTMVGDDGDPGPNQIGVAPHARWMAAKGCESNSCSFDALLSSGQWVMAPTDLNGQNPRPDLAADVVNNSWGGGPGDPFYQGIVQSWVGAGIFPSFSSGNPGSFCGGAGSPGDYPESYGVGAYDINNNIASFSGRGPSTFGGEIKPNIAAPGVNVRSSVPGGYANFSGTSMAAPHLSGAVALMWSAAPALIGDIAATRMLLDDTAVDSGDLSCGGTVDDNNVFGEGRLDALAAVEQSPRGPAGTLTGVVSGPNGPIANARVRVQGPTDRTAGTNAAGQYTMQNLPVGDYTATASAFGFGPETANVTILENQTTTQDFSLTPVPSHTVSGTVLDNNNAPIANATVQVLDTPLPPATTDANGNYAIPNVPEGEYDVEASGGRCHAAQTQHLVVDGPEDLDFTLQQRRDNFGYRCSIVPFGWVDANTVLPLTGDDASTQINLPFPFTFYGETHNVAHVSTNGFLNFLAPNATFSNSGIPSTFPPNGAIYPYWDDMFVDSSASVRTELLGTAPNRRFVIEWRNVAYFADFSRRVDFEVILTETGRILTQYRNIADDGREQGNSATVGIENQTGTDAFQYSLNERALSDGLAVLYRLPPSGFVAGTVTDRNDNLPIAGASVKAIQNGVVVRQTETNDAGEYRLQLELGTYMIEASRTNYVTETREVTLDEEDETVIANFALATARAEVSPTSFEFVIPAGQTRTRVMTLRNTGSATMNWEIAEAGGGRVATTSTLGLVKNPAYNPNSPTTEGLYENPQPGWGPTAPGDVIRTWPVQGFDLPWGVGYDGDVWFSDPLAGGNLCAFISTCHIAEFTVAGAPTGVDWPADWAGAWNGDMALDTTHNCMASVNVGGDNGIYCQDLATGTVVYSITSGGPWTGISQRGLAYRPDDNSFYIGGWNEGILYHIRGNGPGAGEVINQCSPSDPNISGLTWNPAFNIVWAATNSPSDTIYQLNPNTCAVISTLAHPNPGFNGAGLEMDEEGNLWTVSQNAGAAYLIESGVPAFSDVPWLSEDPTSGTLEPNMATPIRITVDTTGLDPGVYQAILFVRTNSGRIPTLRVPVRLIVPAYQTAVNSGNGPYTDGMGDPWSADQGYSSGSWGYTNRSSRSASTRRAISGTDDDPLYQYQRSDPTEYRFDGLPNGVYEVDLRFAEVSTRRPGTRLFDVLLEGGMVLPAHDIAGEVGSFAADNHVFYLAVTDGQLNIRFIERRGYAQPIINAIRVTHRPDR